MFVYLKLAGLTVEVNHPGPHLRAIAAPYMIEPPARSDISVTLTMRDIEYERQRSLEENHSGPYLKSVALLRILASQVPAYDAFLMHAAVVEAEGNGYAFLAPSGTGKSTHIRLWREHLPLPVTVVNGDKPIVRRVDGRYFAYGTPWSGKEDWQTNTSVPLTGLCFLERGEQNTIQRLAPQEAVIRLLKQVYLPPVAAQTARVLEMADELLRQTPAYLLHCNMEPEAAAVAFDAMRPQS